MRGPRPQAARIGARSRGHGLTLVELVVAISIMSILMASVSSVIVLASRALPDPTGSSFAAIAAARMADQIVTELRTAVSITQYSPTMIEFSVERGGVAHTIRYEWSGTPGDPLTRQYDGGPVANVLENVQGFALAYHMKTVTVTSTEVTESDEAILASFTGWPAVTPEEQTVGLDSLTWAGQHFSVDMPSDTERLNVTRVFLMMRQGASGAGSTFTVGIHQAIGGGNPEPQTDPIGTPVTKPGSFLPTSYEWREFVFSDVSISEPGTEYVVLAKGTSATMPRNADGDVQRLYAADAPDNGTTGIWTLDQGASWDPTASVRQYYDYPFYVYGTYETETTVTVVSDTVELLDIQLLAGSAPTIPLLTQAHVLNDPELP